MKKTTCLHFCYSKNKESKVYQTLENIEIKLNVGDKFTYSENYYDLLNTNQKKQFNQCGFTTKDEYEVFAVNTELDNKSLGDVEIYFIFKTNSND